jgi:hypothetical protein
MAERHGLRPAQALIAGIGLVAILSAGASATSTAAFPTQLIGVWERTVSPADFKRAGATHPVAAGAYNMDVEKAKSGIVGNVYISTSTGRNIGLGGTLVPLNPGHLYIVVGFPSGTPAPPNDYRWKVSGKQLAFARVRDSNPDRAAFFVGVWKKARS